MKLKTSITDVPYAINDADLLSKLGWNLVHEEGLEKGLMSEGAVRNFISKYSSDELIDYYNDYVRNHIYRKLDIAPDVHIGVLKINNSSQRGYKIATLRAVSGNYGIMEEIKLGSINTHDLELGKNILLKSEVLKEGDAVIEDRGFISREVINYLKNTRKVDVYIPARKDMNIFRMAVQVAQEQNKWQSHPNKKRTSQKIQFVTELGDYWEHDQEKDVPLNACVVRDSKNKDEEEYYVFLTTDTTKSAKSIIKTYELRPEIEEDYRQLKDFWNLDDFQSTKYNFICFHIVAVLLGYLFFQVYKETERGAKFQKKSLPVVLKNYVMSNKPKAMIVYTRGYFGVFTFVEFLEIYANCPDKIRQQVQEIMEPQQ